MINTKNKTQIGVCKKCNYPIFEGDKFCSYCRYETEIHCEPEKENFLLFIVVIFITIFALILLQYFNR